MKTFPFNRQRESPPSVSHAFWPSLLPWPCSCILHKLPGLRPCMQCCSMCCSNTGAALEDEQENSPWFSAAILGLSS